MSKYNKSPPTKKRRLSLCRSKGKNKEETSRFDLLSTHEVDSAKKFVPKNTSISLKWAYRLFCDWITHCQDIEDRQYKKGDLWLSQDPHQLSNTMSTFCLEV